MYITEKTEKNNEKTMKQKAGFLRRSTNLINFQEDSSGKKREYTNYKHHKWEREINTSSKDLKRIIRKCYGQLCANQLAIEMTWKIFLKDTNYPTSQHKKYLT